MFNLCDYVSTLRKYAEEHQVPATEAVGRFVVNLLMMHESFDGFDPSINFHELGQLWNVLPSGERNKQKVEAANQMSAAMM